jgi:hypothetical protein
MDPIVVYIPPSLRAQAGFIRIRESMGCLVVEVRPDAFSEWIPTAVADPNATPRF